MAKKESPALVEAVRAPEMRATNTVRLSRAQLRATPDLLLWFLIRETTDALSFKNYKAFINYVLCRDETALNDIADEAERERARTEKAAEHRALRTRRFLPFMDTDAYRLLKVATEAFFTVNCGVRPDNLDIPDEEIDDLLDDVGATDGDIVDRFVNDYLEQVNGIDSRVLPYMAIIRRKLEDVPIKTRIFSDNVEDPRAERCIGILQDKLLNPCMVELIWSYWHEQGMQVQTMNALSLRFQNIRGPADRDPLAMVEIDPLRPLNNLLWGYVQDEQHRLTLLRRTYEYDHHYGLTLEGTAVPKLRPADSRSKFLESFHNLLQLASVFYKQDDDTTVVADGFPVLNALKDVHMLLSEGAHNQFGDLPATARMEMLMQQWLLARPEFREVLPSRVMVAYPEEWMDRVDAMKRLQGWIDTSVMHFSNLGKYGEQILLSARFGAWSDTNDPVQAAIWARFWRPQIQGYIHAYRTVTGVDLTASPGTAQQAQMRVAQPSTLLRQRLLTGSQQPMLPAASQMPMPSFRERKALRR